MGRDRLSTKGGGGLSHRKTNRVWAFWLYSGVRGLKIGSFTVKSYISAALLSCPDKMREEKLHLSCGESFWTMYRQVLPSYLLAGQGMVIAGMLLDHVQVGDSS